MLKLLCTRHAESVGNRDRRLATRGSDPLTPHGIHQAQQLGRALRDQQWWPTHLYCSPLERARQTVAIAVEQMGQSPDLLTWLRSPPGAERVDLRVAWGEMALPEPVTAQRWTNLQEIENGVLSGLTWAEVQDRYPDLSQQLMTQAEWVPIPGGEPLADRRDRARQVITQIVTQHGNGDRVWIMSHAGFLTHLMSEVLGSDRTWGIAIPNTAQFECWLDVERWGRSDVNRWNDTLWQIRRFNQLP